MTTSADAAGEACELDEVVVSQIIYLILASSLSFVCTLLTHTEFLFSDQKDDQDELLPD